ncbi:folylpolyglutamate synthase/dihydrofolate synthase family protein [Pontibacter sp. G13]|uniref:bifunctional folylpolyglutamate synthase/dihydrofolate synthase n=1 Tax=Pontibacter sp. G13 TaxID=3074898 RepID=UPI0028899268|nr:folylpolyglutamate synthase/dihydrofolate synthase family protein [Pontibacter sp. G13]WNJ20528.1 folylpolyglutamate synthase/dihydrofolate synthase family protein [Pontibacter sp. G13]
MTDRRYEQTLAYLYSLLPMYQKVGNQAFKKSLDNIKDLCWDLGLPQWQFKSIHVAGTNGKGSVSSMLSSILQESGYKVGLYTSPHLASFTERVRINGEQIPQNNVVDFVNMYRHSIEQIAPSFFELTVAMAFDYFAEQEVDIAVIEVGLGGRLDSTNIIRPEISVITNISLDHTHLLGNTLPEIAREKGGIIKPYTPVIVGERHPETDEVFQELANQHDAPIHFAQDEYDLLATDFNPSDSTRTYIQPDKSGTEKSYELDLLGDYQRKNLATVLSTVDWLRADGWLIPSPSVDAGLRKVIPNAGLLGRMQLIRQTPKTLCDTAHNEAGLSAVIAQLENMEAAHIHIVWGMVDDKQHATILKLLPKEATYYFVKPDVPRGLDALTLQLMAEGQDLSGTVHKSVWSGLQSAWKHANPRDLVFVGGSTFVVADALRALEESPQD